MNRSLIFRRWSRASLACSVIAFISHCAAMAIVARVVSAFAQGRAYYADQAQRFADAGAFDLVALTGGVLAIVLALVAARGETPRMRMLVFAAAVIANLWNFCLV
jgi:hypothetical protein